MDIKFFDSAEITGVYVEDIKKDTFIYTDVIYADIADWSIRDEYVTVSNARLQNGSVFIRKYEGDSTLNFQHIVDYFKTDDDDTTKSDFLVGVESFTLDNIHFIYDDFNHEPSKNGMDFSHIDLTKISGTFSDFSLKGDQIGVRLDQLQLLDKSGLALQNLSANLQYSSDKLTLNKLKIRLNRSKINAPYFELSTPNGGEDWRDFVNRVQFNAHVKNSSLYLSDLAFFVPDLWGMQEEIRIKNLKGKNQVYGMRLTEVDISMMDTTRLKGDLQIPNLSDLENAYFQEDIDLFRTSIDDIQRLNLKAILDNDTYLKLNKNLTQFRNAKVIQLDSGSFAGFLSNFTVNGSLTSGIGSIRSEYGLTFTYLPEENIYAYKGVNEEVASRDVIVQNLHLGTIARNKVIGAVSGSLINVNGKGFGEKDIDIKFTGDFSAIDILDYRYNNIVVKQGHFSNNVFEGKIDVTDDNLALNYEGKVDLKGKMHFDFEVTIDSAQVAELSGQEQKIYQRLASKIDVDIHGTGVNELYGDVNIEGFSFQTDSGSIVMNELDLHITRHEEVDSIVLRSPFVDLDLRGKYDLEDIGHALTEQFSYVISNVVEDRHDHDADHEFYELSVRVKDLNSLFVFLGEDIEMSSRTILRSEFDHETKEFALDLNCEYLDIYGTKFQDLKIENHFDSSHARMYYSSDFVQVTDSMAIRNVYFDSEARENKFVTDAGWDGVGDMDPALFAFVSEISPEKDVLTEFKPSFFFLEGHQYKINKNSKSTYSYNTDRISFDGFKISNKEDQYIGLDGIVSHDPNDWLNIVVQNFDLSDLNGIVGEFVELDGTLNVNARLADVYEDIRFNAQSAIDSLHLDKNLVGNIELKNRYNERHQSISSQGTLFRDGKRTFTFEGDYFLKRKENLDFEAKFARTDIAFLNAFDDPELFTDIEGIIDGKVHVNGALSNPIVTGKLDILHSKVKIPMFNVYYGAAGLIKLNDGEIIADHLAVSDQEGNMIESQMQIYHYGWADWNYNIWLDMEEPKGTRRFLAMDTKFKEGDIYYGKAYVTGFVNISGYDKHTDIEVEATTEKGTALTLPMYGSSELEEGSFIIFDNTFFLPDSLKDPDVANEINEVMRTGMTLAMKFKVTKDAEVKIVFDPILEDQIVSRGEGSLEINLDEFGDPSMYGEYIIRKGQYEMNIKQILTEDIQLRDGSTVLWSGSPYDARIDIQADFERDVTLSDILPPTGKKRKPEKVIGTFDMQNTLMNPEIGFDISYPGSDDIGKKAIAEVKADADEKNKQFFALLILKRFIPKYGALTSGGDAALDVLEGQLNSAISGLSENYDLGFDLGEVSTTIDVQTQLSDRITVKTSTGIINNEDASSGASVFVADVDFEYRLNDDGSFTVNFFNETNSSNLTSQGDYTQGVSMHYQETFNTTKQFKMWQKFLNMFRKKQNRVKFEETVDSTKWIPIDSVIIIPNTNP